MKCKSKIMDLDVIGFELIKRAADASNWIPKQYTCSDWINDVCNFLRFGSGNLIDKDRSITNTIYELEKEVHFTNSNRMFILITDIIYLIGCIKQYIKDNDKLAIEKNTLLDYAMSRGHDGNCAIRQCGHEFKCTCGYNNLMEKMHNTGIVKCAKK